MIKLFKHFKFHYEYVLFTRCPWVEVDLSSQFSFKSVSIAFSFLIGKNAKVKKNMYFLGFGVEWQRGEGR